MFDRERSCDDGMAHVIVSSRNGIVLCRCLVELEEECQSQTMVCIEASMQVCIGVVIDHDLNVSSAQKIILV
jgi:hypothetical protein